MRKTFNCVNENSELKVSNNKMATNFQNYLLELVKSFLKPFFLIKAGENLPRRYF